MEDKELDIIKQLAEQIGQKYSEVWRIDLTGSRARGEATPQSDWDLAVQLDESVYKHDVETVESIEQKVQFDSTVQNSTVHVHIFFLRPPDFAGFPVFCHGNDDALVLLKKDSEDVYRESVPYMFLFWQSYISFLHDFARFAVCLYRNNNKSKGE